jgi:hypothetical protein
MGIFSWFGSRKSGGNAGKRGRHRSGQPVMDPGGGYPSLVRRNVESPELEEVQRAAAEDVARVREGDEYFKENSPDRNPDGL